MLEELDLGLGVLLRGIRDEQYRVRRRQGSQRGQRVRRIESADTRRVDDSQPALEDLARKQNLRRHDPAFIARIALL
jgi:hypothetical protein